uniref:Uncharacterized protein n=1 Tax=Oryza barthii TaxID=65489 RepID=A0A0D3GH86_9ORYZ
MYLISASWDVLPPCAAPLTLLLSMRKGMVPWIVATMHATASAPRKLRSSLLLPKQVQDASIRCFTHRSLYMQGYAILESSHK